MDKRADFTQGAILPKLLRFALPILGAMILQVMYGAVDLMVVGRFADAAAVSAVSTGSQLMHTITTVVTGLSMGGTGTWMLAMAAPDRFAAIAPICGSGIYWNGCTLSNIPIMVYHGDCDLAVPIENSIEMVRSVNMNGGNAQIKVLYGVKHNAWDYAYKGDELYTWLLSHTRKQAE